MPITSNASRLQAALQIHREIMSGTYPSATMLGEKLDVSAKTARKYVELLADIFGVNPIYDEVRHGYHYENATRASLVPRLREDEVAAVFLIEQAARSLAGSPVQKVLESVLGKLSLMMPTGCDITLGELSDALSLRLERASSVSDQHPETLNTLYDALVHRRRVSMVYAGRDRAETTRRKIDPIHLTRCEGQWYLVAHCHLRKEIRTFVPARMKDVRVLSETFQRPADFDPQKHFKSAFGIVAGRDVQQVKLRFCREVAGLIRERQWHPTQVIEDLPDGEVRLTMTCSQGPELEAWILSWGEQVAVEGPKELEGNVKARHKAAAQ
ncbi:MAG TPA: WYL domain-containing protein [Planctomycetota bacterium]|jgi:predicted DNA-binding transcriptional regulator YafY